MPILESLRIKKNAAAGKVLMADALGNATWQNVPTSSAGVFDGGSATTNYAGVAGIDAGGAV